MRVRWALAGAFALLAMFGGASAQDQPSCQMSRKANLPVTVNKYGMMTVPVTIQGREYHLLLDTGSQASFLNENLVRTLGLKREVLEDWWITFFGGRKTNRFTFVEGMVIGRLRMPRLPVMIYPGDETEFDGLLGNNLLSTFDLDLDLANGMVAIYSQDHCPGNVVYWSKDPYAAIPFWIDSDGHIRFDVTIDGKTIPAMLDTGAADSIISMEYAKPRFNVTDEQIESKTFHFKEMTLNGVTVHSPDIALVSNSVSRIWGGIGKPKLIIGMNVLRWLHIYIAYEEHKIYATAAGAH